MKKIFIICITILAIAVLSLTILGIKALSVLASQGDIITANGFHLLDKTGKRVASLAISEDGFPVLVFFNKDTQLPVAYFGSSPNGAIIGFKDREGRTRFRISFHNQSGPAISFVAQNKKLPLMILGLHRTGTPALAFFDRKGVGRMTLALKPDGSPAIGMLGPDKQSRLHIQAPEDRGPMITMHPGSDRPAVVLGLIHDRPVLTLYTRYRSGVVAGVNQSGEPVLGLMRNGQTTWTPVGAASPSADQDLDRAVDDLLR